ncbi:MAG: rhodanese-like domain-containing protein [Dehalococcoidia bacterium]|nr:rhodanese-like domain-containing protein [Chloroflexota bacterium]
MVTSIGRDEVQMLLRDEGAQLVEVLPRREYEDEHVKDAINISLKRLDRESAKRLDKGRPVIVY